MDRIITAAKARMWREAQLTHLKRSSGTSSAHSLWRGMLDATGDASARGRPSKPDPQLTADPLPRTSSHEITERTRSRSVALGTLNFLVDTGAISDLEALDRIQGWKQPNRFGH